MSVAVALSQHAPFSQPYNLRPLLLHQGQVEAQGLLKLDAPLTLALFCLETLVEKRGTRALSFFRPISSTLTGSLGS